MNDGQREKGKIKIKGSIKMNIPATKDVIQEAEGNLEVPEIRVWCHPHFINESGSDSYQTFDTFQEALDFIKVTKSAEPMPMIAFRGHEFNLWAA